MRLQTNTRSFALSVCFVVSHEWNKRLFRPIEKTKTRAKTEHKTSNHLFKLMYDNQTNNLSIILALLLDEINFFFSAEFNVKDNKCSFLSRIFLFLNMCAILQYAYTDYIQSQNKINVHLLRSTLFLVSVCLSLPFLSFEWMQFFRL